MCLHAKSKKCLKVRGCEINKLKNKLLAHFIVSTIVFVPLLFWLISSYDSKNLDSLIIAVVIQNAVFALMFYFLESSSINRAFEESFGIKQLTPEEHKKLPTIKDILLILIAVALGVLFTYFLVTNNIESDTLIYNFGIFTLVFFWSTHVWASYRKYVKAKT